MSGAGSGEVRLEFLDDVDRDTAKVNNKYLKYNSTTGKFVGSDPNALNKDSKLVSLSLRLGSYA